MFFNDLKTILGNNREEFMNEMQLFGVYVPEQDASWERPTEAAAADADASSEMRNPFDSLRER